MENIDFFSIGKKNIESESSPGQEDDKSGDNGANLIPVPNLIVERKIYTITTFRIYPNGQMFITSSKSWFDKKGEIIIPKPKKNPIKVKKTSLQEEESY